MLHDGRLDFSTQQIGRRWRCSVCVQVAARRDSGRQPMQQHLAAVLPSVPSFRLRSASVCYRTLSLTDLPPAVSSLPSLPAGGELLDAVLEKGHYSEADARSCFLQIMRAIQYLHSRCAGQGLG